MAASSWFYTRNHGVRTHPIKLSKDNFVDFHSQLSDHQIYQSRIEKLQDHLADSGGLYSIRQEGVSFATIAFNAPKVSRLIAKAVAKGDYKFRPAMVRQIDVEGKIRRVFSLNLTDTIVHGAISNLIENALALSLSSRVFSYRKGVSWWTPSAQFASYVRHYRKMHPDPKDRGICVLRRDIDSYTDSIPVDANSRLWELIKKNLCLDTTESAAAIKDWELVESVVRPVVDGPQGHYSQIRGVPTGQPISCVLFNLYLGDLDQALSEIPGAFYARYCDDILFAHPDAEVTQGAARIADEILTGLRIRFNAAKNQNIYLNDSGRPSNAWVDLRGSTRVEYVGLQISADGTTSLSRKKQRSLLREMEQRAIRTARIMSGKDVDQVGISVCSVINRALDPNGDLFQQRTAGLVRKGVTNRDQLAQIDYLLARIVLYAVTGNRDVRNFRKLPFKKIRNDWGLISLVHSRNRWSRGPECKT